MSEWQILPQRQAGRGRRQATLWALMFTSITLAACATSTPPLSATPISVGQLEQLCAPLEPAPPQDAFSGTIALGDPSGSLFLLEDGNGPKPAAGIGPTSIVVEAAVSPDRRRFAYVVENHDESFNSTGSILHVIRAGGAQEVSIPKSDTWATLYGWLDNQQLLFVPIEYPVGTMIIVDPLTGHSEVLAPLFPNVYNNNPPTHWRNSAVVVYDSTLTRVGYLRSSASDGIGVVLWDLIEGRELWHLNHSDVISTEPQWSADDQYLAVAAPADSAWYHYEMFVVGRDGTVTQLTDMSDTYPAAIIGTFSWSPSGDQIAFWLETRHSATSTEVYPQRLVVAELSKHRLIDYCVTGNQVSSARPIWSPDGTQLIVQHWRDPNSSQVVLLDLTAIRAFTIANDMTPLGWIQ